MLQQLTLELNLLLNAGIGLDCIALKYLMLPAAAWMKVITDADDSQLLICILYPVSAKLRYVPSYGREQYKFTLSS